jgi:hypothetical protein
MNLFNIFSEVEKTEPEVYERLNDRRAALKQFSGFAGKVALVSMPILIGSMFKKAYAGTTDAITDVLNFALTLEYLEADFYTQGVAASGLIPSADMAGFTTIRDHENEHVNFLKTAIQGAGGTAVTKPNFDFTAHGTYPDVFTNYTTFLTISQAFEDTGVRAYKGQAGNLMSNKTILTAALQIHSVEARHASHVRYIRQQKGASVKPWITGNTGGGAPAPVYAGEENTTQLGVTITNINGTGISANAASEAFDEPLTKDQVLAIAQPFFA